MVTLPPSDEDASSYPPSDPDSDPPTNTESDFYAGGDLRRREEWLNTITWIRRKTVSVLFCLGFFLSIAFSIALVHLVVVVLVHYTVPPWGWMSDDELRRLGTLYSRFATAAVPAALISNAWLIWWFSRDRRHPDGRDLEAP